MPWLFVLVEVIFTIPSQSKYLIPDNSNVSWKKQVQTIFFLIDVQVLSLIEFVFWNFLSTLN